MLDNLENITEDMNSIGFEGKWYSHVKDMDIFRIRYLDDEVTIWLANDNGQTIIDTPDAQYILSKMRKRL